MAPAIPISGNHTLCIAFPLKVGWTEMSLLRLGPKRWWLLPWKPFLALFCGAPACPKDALRQLTGQLVGWGSGISQQPGWAQSRCPARGVVCDWSPRDSPAAASGGMQTRKHRLSHTHVPHSREWRDKHFLFLATKFWGNFLCSNR